MDYNLLEKYIGIILLNKDKYVNKRIIIEYSEGLKDYAKFIYNKLQEKLGENCDIFLNGDPRFGACDVDVSTYLEIKPSLVIHLGHTPFSFPRYWKNRIYGYDVYYIPVYEAIKDSDWILDVLSKERKKALLVASIQYVPFIRKIYLELKRRDGYRYINIPKISGLAGGQIIGCLSSYLRKFRSKYEKIFVVSSGYFHAIGVALYSGVETFLLDVRRKEAINLSDKVRSIKSLIAWNIYRSENSETFGILIAKNPIQRWIAHYNTIIRLMKKHEKKFLKIYLDRIEEHKINQFYEVDSFVSAACPRLAIDDITRFKKPILNLEQLLILFGYKMFGDVYP